MSPNGFTPAEQQTPSLPQQGVDPKPLRKRPARKKPAAKRKPRKAKGAAKAPATRRGPAALTMDVNAAFGVLQGCKRKDVAAIQAITAQLNGLNRKSRERVMHAVGTILNA